MSTSWDAKLYSQFLELRTRPAFDLLSAIPKSFKPQTVYDLGCGPGNSTILLKNRWPDAQVSGLDSSLAMLEEARISYPSINFIKGDITNFSPSEKIDCLFSNAALQWLGAHEILFPQLIQTLNFGGAFAIQIPNTFHMPTHQIAMQILQNEKEWQPLIKKVFYGVLTKPLFDPSWYYDLLAKAGLKNLQIWETEYFQELENHQAIFDWIKGAGLRPVILAMNTQNQEKFATRYVEIISKVYPLQINNKVLLPFKRLFLIGIK